MVWCRKDASESGMHVDRMWMSVGWDVHDFVESMGVAAAVKTWQCTTDMIVPAITCIRLCMLCNNVHLLRVRVYLDQMLQDQDYGVSQWF